MDEGEDDEEEENETVDPIGQHMNIDN